MKKSKSTLKVIKEESISSNDTSFLDSDSDLDSESYSTSSYTSNTETETDTITENYKYLSIVNSKYKRPKEGTIQDKFTIEDINERIEGYTPLTSSKDKQYLLELTPFKTWIKYYNLKEKKFRTGGLLMKVDPDLNYIMLINTKNKLSWSVQLKDNIIFVPNINKTKEKENEKQIKENLYELYKKGLLKVKKNK